MNLLKMEQYDRELENFCNTMNPIYLSCVESKKRYAELLDYFRVQLHQGYITKEQFHERAKKLLVISKERNR